MYIAKHLIITRDEKGIRREFKPGASLPADEFSDTDLVELLRTGATEEQPDPVKLEAPFPTLTPVATDTQNTSAAEVASSAGERAKPKPAKGTK